MKGPSPAPKITKTKKKTIEKSDLPRIAGLGYVINRFHLNTRTLAPTVELCLRKPEKNIGKSVGDVDEASISTLESLESVMNMEYLHIFAIYQLVHYFFILYLIISHLIISILLWFCSRTRNAI